MERTMSINSNLPPRSPMINTVLGLLVITATKSIQSAQAAGGRNEYCPGFIDKHGMWNNGFQCPKWGEPGQRYCCGTDTYRFCCPTHQPTVPLLRTVGPTESTNLHQHVLLVTFIFGTLILFTGTAVIMCFHCRCCLVYQRRKRSHREAGIPIEGRLANRRRHIWGFDFSTSSSRTTQPEFIALRPPSYQEEEPPAYDDLTVPHTSKEKRHHGGFELDTSESPLNCHNIGLFRFNNETKRLSSNQTTQLLDLDHPHPTRPILASNLRHSADSSRHAPNAIRRGRYGRESNNIEAPNEQLLIGGRQKEQPSSSGLSREQPFRDKKLHVCLQNGGNQCCSISLPVSASTRNKCQSETESDACSGDGYQLVSEDCVSIASATMVTDSEDEVRNSLRVYVNRCR